MQREWGERAAGRHLLSIYKHRNTAGGRPGVRGTPSLAGAALCWGRTSWEAWAGSGLDRRSLSPKWPKGQDLDLRDKKEQGCWFPRVGVSVSVCTCV